MQITNYGYVTPFIQQRLNDLGIDQQKLHCMKCGRQFGDLKGGSHYCKPKEDDDES